MISRQEINQCIERVVNFIVTKNDLKNDLDFEFEASKGYDYSHSVLQDKDLHKLQHKYDGMGKKNKKNN